MAVKRVPLGESAAPPVVNDHHGAYFRGLNHSFCLSVILLARARAFDKEHVDSALVVLITHPDECELVQECSYTVFRGPPAIEFSPYRLGDQYLLEEKGQRGQ